MGRVSHQDVFSFDNHGCMCDDLMGDEDDCCNDEVAIITIDEDQNIVGQFPSVIPKLVVLFVFDKNQYLNDELLKSQRSYDKYSEDPPIKSSQPLYLLYSNYTFYG